MSGQLTFDDRGSGKEKTADERNYEAARSDEWVCPETAVNLNVRRKVGEPSMREFVDDYVHIGDLLRMVGTYAGHEFRTGTVVRFDYADRPVIENSGSTVTVDLFKIRKVKKGAGLSEGDVLRHDPLREETKAVQFMQFDGWPWMRVKYGLGAITVSLLDVDRVILPGEPGEKGAPWGTPDDYEWAVGKPVRPATRLRPFEVKDVEWGEYAGQERPQYVTSTFHPDWNTAWCDEFVDRWAPVIML